MTPKEWKGEIVNGIGVVYQGPLTEKEYDFFNRLANLITRTLRVHTCIFNVVSDDEKGIKKYKVEINGIPCEAYIIAKGSIRSTNDINMRQFFRYIVSKVGEFNYENYGDD